jgi:hypothetical protein
MPDRPGRWLVNSVAFAFMPWFVFCPGRGVAPKLWRPAATPGAGIPSLCRIELPMDSAPGPSDMVSKNVRWNPWVTYFDELLRVSPSGCPRLSGLG